MKRPFTNLPLQFSWRDQYANGTSLALPRQNTLLPTLIVGVMFAIFAGVLLTQISRLNLHAFGSVFDLMTLLFQLFWILGWSVGVLALGLIFVFLCCFKESAHLTGAQLVYGVGIGPFKMIVAYDLGRLRNPRVEAEAGNARVCFDYDDVPRRLGNSMSTSVAEHIVSLLRAAIPNARQTPAVHPAAQLPEVPSKVELPEIAQVPRWPLVSMTALVAANLVPLFGVLFANWSVADVMVLFWAESAVIGFYTLLKMVVVGKGWALFSGVFFIAHFGGFMSIHFLFIYELFVRGLHARGPEVAPSPHCYSCSHRYGRHWLRCF